MISREGLSVISAENGKDRAHKVALLGQQNSYDVEQYKKEKKDLLLTMLGQATFEGILGAIS